MIPRSIPRSRIVPILLLMLAALPVGTGSVRAQATPVAASQAQYTPLLPSVLSPPRWFYGADEQVHLVYELLLTNAFPVPIELTSIDVLDADTGRAVATLTGDPLAAATSLLPDPNTPTPSLPTGTVGVVWFDVPLANPELLPATIMHRLTVSVPPGLPVPPTITATGGAAMVDLRSPVILGPPLAGVRWVAAGSCCDGPHRRAFQAIDGELHLSQRFAIDFNQLDAENRTSAGDASLNTSFPSYGQPLPRWRMPPW